MHPLPIIRTMSKNPPRLFVDTELGPDTAIDLDGNPAHYLRDVMRLGTGDDVRVFNGRDGEWRASVLELGRRSVTLNAIEQTRPQPPSAGPRLVFAPVKKTGTTFIIEKATELGAARLSPVITEFTDRARLKTERLQAIAIEAAEQCGRLSVPIIDAPRPLADFLAQWDTDAPLIIADESGGGGPVLDVLAGLPALTAGSQTAPAFVIGPQGGFSKSELVDMRQLSNVIGVDLGPRILRAETAAIAVLTCWQACRGDWQDD